MDLRFGTYYDNDAPKARLRHLVDQHGDVLELRPPGTSHEGREIPLGVATNRSPGPDHEKAQVLGGRRHPWSAMQGASFMITGDLTLMPNSPCLPQHNSCEVQVGACGLGCAGPVAIEDLRWGAIKARYDLAGRPRA